MSGPPGTALRMRGLLRDGPQTAQTLASRLGLDVSSVRRHLDGLTQRGWATFEDHVDGPGRPKRHYRLTEAGWESFPRDYAFLLGAVLDKVQEGMGREAVHAMFAEVAADLAAPIDGHGSAAVRLEALRQLYLELGFEPSLETVDGQPCLVQRNCPFLQTAKGDPEGLCACLDEGIIRNVIPEADVRLGECMATGDNRCTHRITLPAT